MLLFVFFDILFLKDVTVPGTIIETITKMQSQPSLLASGLAVLEPQRWKVRAALEFDPELISDQIRMWYSVFYLVL